MARITNIGTINQTEKFSIDKDDIKYFNVIAANVAREELQHEKKIGNLINHNRFVDGRQNVPEEAIRFGGKIVYEDVFSLLEVMKFIDKVVYRLMPKSTGDLMFSHGWYLNGGQLLNDQKTPALHSSSDQLTCFAHIRYAKYQESGTIKNTAKKMYKLAALRASRRFGRAFIIEHKFIQDREISTIGRVITKVKANGRKYKAFTKDYYKDRWANSYPGIKISLRRNVLFKENNAPFTNL